MLRCSFCGTDGLWLFKQYHDFYGVADYGDKFVMGALGTPANGYAAGPVGFAEHDMDFSSLNTGSTTDASKGRYELIEKGIQHLSVWMYVYRMLEAAVAQCVPDVISGNDAAVRTWDGAMAFYTGSLEGQEGSLDNGVFPHNQVRPLPVLASPYPT